MTTTLPSDPNAGSPFDLARSARLPDPPTPLIGREREIGELLALWEQPRTRLVTLTGPGGIGKTRLAITLAWALEARTGVAVGFIPLASVRDHSLVDAGIGAVFGLSESGDQPLADRLPMVLQDMPVMLVVDNFEHVIDAAPVVRRLLDSCPTLSFLATSRRPLNLSGEIDYVVPPLATPGQDDAPEQILQSASYRLFVDRAAARWDRTEQMAAIGALCARLEGLPLAIELAAARTRVLAPSELLDRLDRRLPLLTGGPVDAPARLRSMHEAVAWSYELLSDDEQRLLRVLAVFHGGFTFDAVEAVAPENLKEATLELLTQLLDHSLVRRMESQDGLSRFTMLETVREFALAELQSLGEETAARHRHVQWFAAGSGPLLPEWWFEPRGRTNSTTPLDDHDNLRAALSWSLSNNQPGLASQIAARLMEFWWRNGLNAEAATALKRILETPGSLDPVAVAGITVRLAFFEYVCGNFARARALAEGTLQMCRDLGYDLGVSVALHCLGHVTRWSDGAASIQYFDDALRIARSIEDEILVDSILIQLGSTHMAIGNLELARNLKRDAVANLRSRQDAPDALAIAQAGLGWVEGLLGNLTEAEKLAIEATSTNQNQHFVEPLIIALRVRGNVALARRHYALAAEFLKEALQVARGSSISHLEGSILTGLAKIAASQGDWRQSALLFGYLDTLWHKLGFSPVARRMLSAWDDSFEPGAEEMANAGYRQAFEAGRILSQAEAYAQAMGVTVADTPAARDANLTRREREILLHLAQGQTNQEIADDLFLGKSTVDTHVRNILAKLGVESRRAAVRAARDRGLLPG